jgi:hypothetical protein
VQTWSLSHLQKIVLNTIKNPFPIGFIYVQLPNEKSPTEIWSWMIWKDVTSDYAGLFFRAEGGDAAAFEKIQEQYSPKLTEVQTYHNETPAVGGNVLIKPGEWSENIYSGSHGGGPDQHYVMRFYMSSGEVRPRNMAIRIWKRTR